VVMSGEAKAALLALSYGDPPDTPGLPDPTASANTYTADAVPMLGLSASLKVPYRDNATGEARLQSFAVELRQAGDTYSASVGVLNDWVRLLYGALAYPGFQSEPASLEISYSYEAYVPSGEDYFQAVYGAKSQYIPVLKSPSDTEPPPQTTYIDATKWEFR